MSDFEYCDKYVCRLITDRFEKSKNTILNGVKNCNIFKSTACSRLNQLADHTMYQNEACVDCHMAMADSLCKAYTAVSNGQSKYAENFWP